MDNEVDAPSPGWLEDCERCGASFNCIDDLKKLFDDNVNVLVEGKYCAACIKELSMRKADEDSHRYAEAMASTLERLDNGQHHAGHEALVEAMVQARNDAEKYRQDEYTYDVAVLAASIGLMSEDELAKMVLVMKHFSEDEGHEYAQYAGRFDAMRKQLSGWLSDMNELCSDFCLFSVKKSIIHKMDNDKEES